MTWNSSTKRLALFSLCLLLSACAGKTPKPETSPAEAPAAPAAGSETATEPNAPPAGGPTLGATPLPLADYYRILTEEEPSLAFLRKSDAVVKVNKTDPGYIAVESPELRRGGMVFALFRGQGRDLIVQETKSCGQGCSYSYLGFQFFGPKHERVLLSHLLPMDQIQHVVKRSVPSGRRAGKMISGWPRAEHLRLMIPQNDKPISLYVLRELTSKRKEDVSYYDVGTLHWDPAAFHFTFSPRGKAKGLGKLDAY